MRRSYKRFSWLTAYDNILKTLMIDEGRWDLTGHHFQNGYNWTSILSLFLDRARAQCQFDVTLNCLTGKHLERRWFSHIHPALPRDADDELRRIHQFLSAYLNANSTVPSLSLPNSSQLRQACHLLGSNEWILRKSREIWTELMNFETESELEFDMNPIDSFPDDLLWDRLEADLGGLDVVPQYLLQALPPCETVGVPVSQPGMVEGIAGLFPVSSAPETMSPINDVLPTQPFLCPEEGVPGLAGLSGSTAPMVDDAEAMLSLRSSRISPCLFLPSRPMSPALTPRLASGIETNSSVSPCEGIELAADEVLFSYGRMDCQ